MTNTESISIANVPIIYQYPILPTGCEATSLTMLLQWVGLELSKEQVADSLIKEPNPQVPPDFIDDGKTVCVRTPGGNPHRAFVGDPYDKDSFGVFHEPIAEALNRFLPGRALDLSGCSFHELLDHVRVNQVPVIVWASIELREPRVTDTWPDVKKPDSMITWQSPEHCMILVGFSSDTVIINDPHTGRQEHYDRNLFEKRWMQLGQQAVTVLKQ